MSSEKNFEFYHWLTSPIEFPSDQVAELCLKALEQKSNQSIIQRKTGLKVSYEGFFDMGDFGEEIWNIVSEFCMSSCQYSIKYIYNQADGKFGAWGIKIDGKNEVLNEITLSEILE